MRSASATNRALAVKAGLETQLQSQLRDARIVRAGDRSEAAAANRRCWSEEVGVVEHIEVIDPELQDAAFEQREVAHQRSVPVDVPRPGKRVLLEVSEGSGGRNRKSFSVQVQNARCSTRHRAGAAGTLIHIGHNDGAVLQQTCE